MIDGLKLQVTSKELKEHCVERASYHTERATEKEEHLPKLRESLEFIGANMNPDAVAHMNKMSANYNLDPNEPVRDLERDIQDHRNKALVFLFFSEHLFSEDYNLSEADLRRLEIVK